ncbi:S-adenosyl-L-methionine-dependent methyltransferase [Hypomontagnella submonticulosa]|nr:S-adenosyl-L-methionine-dependent methyltransferase [Hypomontagnella submonticulosa]
MDPMIGLSPNGSPLPGLGYGWEEEEQSSDRNQAAIERRFQEMPSRPDRIHIDLTLGQDDEVDRMEEENEAMLEPEIAKVIEVIDLTKQATPRRPRKVLKPPKRNSSVVLPSRCLDSYTHNDMELKPGVTVEFAPIPELRYASFLLVQLIIHTELGVVLRGLPLTRTRNLRGQLPRLRNEVAFVLEIDKDDFRPDKEQAAIEIHATTVQNTRICHITNKNFPDHRYPKGIYKNTQEIEERGVLVCRWVCRFIWGDALKRLSNKPPTEFVVSRITSNEVLKEKFRAPDWCLVNMWRGGKVRGGSFIPDEPDSARLTVNIDTSGQHDLVQDEWIPKKQGQKYIFADMFCGAGGASCGAESAGFHVKLACDHAVGACNTYRVQYPDTDLREEDMYDFIMSMRASRYHVDVLHLSPPCQVWSPAHTTPGVNDDANIAILFACHELVKMLRPRIFTVEQTFGILHPRFEYYFNALIHGFTQHGYSVRWKVVNLLVWGAPSQRQRLIMIGSCLGEELPPYPVATHSEAPQPGDATKPYRTVRKMLRKIPREAIVYDDLHEPGRMKRTNKPRWNPDVPLTRTITCSGGVGNYHYSGRRDFTLREYAVLQGFPVDYQFQRPQQKKQIGNAFPPLVVEIIYKHLRRWLEQKDQVFATEDELSESDDDGSDRSSRPDLEHSSGSGCESDVEYLGSVLTINDSDSDDCMEIDETGQTVCSPSICIDAVQVKGNIPARPIELD